MYLNYRSDFAKIALLAYVNIGSGELITEKKASINHQPTPFENRR